MDPNSVGHISNRFIKDILDLSQKKIITDDNEVEMVKQLIQQYVEKYPKVDGLEDYLREAWMRIQANEA